MYNYDRERFGSYKWLLNGSYNKEAETNGDFLRCPESTEGWFACEDGLYPMISVADREKLIADNPFKVCYDADGKDEPPCKDEKDAKEGNDPLPY